jgi:hypothetical protein
MHLIFIEWFLDLKISKIIRMNMYLKNLLEKSDVSYSQFPWSYLKCFMSLMGELLITYYFIV